MHRRTWIRTLAGLAVCGFFISPSLEARAETACLEPAQLAHAGVRIARYFDDAERAAQDDGTVGIQGSGWFLTPTAIVTIAHVVTAMNLTGEDWKPIEIRDGDRIWSTRARIKRLVGSGTDKVAVLELQTAIPAARSLSVRAAPLAPDERVVTLAYTAGRARFVSGRFVHYGDEHGAADGAMLEMYDGKDRLAVDYGASGAPVFDCNGRVAAVVAGVLTQTLMLGGEVRVSTAWGMPNVLSVPVQALRN
ncbi:MAG TPA: serine protease [Xanthobacteraceae bacterium]|jgi:hypothetical protein